MNGSSMRQFKRSRRSDFGKRAGLAESAAMVTDITHSNMVNMAGEVRVPVLFTGCRFSEMPTIHHGIELKSSYWVGRAPQWSAVVDDWIGIPRIPDSYYYTGVYLIVTMDAPVGTKYVLHTTATGMGFTGPLEVD